MKSARDRLIVALDVPSAEQARALIEALGDSVGVYKIGLELMFAGGMALATELASRGSRVFLDAKLLDIEATVERATASIARTGAEFLTVHAVDRKTLDAAVRGRGDSKLKLLGVTVLDQSRACGPDPAGHRHSAGQTSCCIGRCSPRKLASMAWWLPGSRQLRSAKPQAPASSSSRRASGLREVRPRTRLASSLLEKRFPQAPTISWSGGPSPRRLTRGKRRRRSSPK